MIGVHTGWIFVVWTVITWNPTVVSLDGVRELLMYVIRDVQLSSQYVRTLLIKDPFLYISCCNFLLTATSLPDH